MLTKVLPNSRNDLTHLGSTFKPTLVFLAELVQHEHSNLLFSLKTYPDGRSPILKDATTFPQGGEEQEQESGQGLG